MDSVAALLERAHKAGVKLEANGGELLIEADDECRVLVQELRRRKREVLRALNPEPSPEPTMRPAMRCFAEIEAEPVRWLWPARIAIGKLTLISGDPGLGKSFFTIDLAARVSTGAPWPDGGHAPLGSVIFLNAEDDPGDTIRPRLDAAGADVKRVFVVDAIQRRDEQGEFERGVDLGTDLEAIEAAIRTADNCKLLVVDPISAYCGSADSHKNAEVRGLLKPLSDMASKHGVAVVAISHLRKGDGAAIYRSMGSMAFTAAARAAFAVCRDPEDDSRRLFLPVKNNLGNDSNGLSYRLVGEDGTTPHVEWNDAPELRTADDVMQAASVRRSIDDQRDEAERLLRDELKDGPKPSKQMLEAAREHGISEKTIRQIYRDAGGQPRKGGMRDGWLWPWPSNWISPDEAAWGTTPEDAVSQETGIFGKSACFSEDGGNLRQQGNLRQRDLSDSKRVTSFDTWNDRKEPSQ